MGNICINENELISGDTQFQKNLNNILIHQYPNGAEGHTGYILVNKKMIISIRNCEVLILKDFEFH